MAYLELGLHHTPLTKKKDGYFVSSNFAADPALIRDDTPGFDPNDPESTMNARHIRAEEFMKEHYGKLDTALAEAYLSDHYDTYEHKIDAGKRSLCGHEDTSPVGEKVWGDPPFDPAGAVTGKVMDSDMAAKMSFIGRAGHPCGEDFMAAPFLAAHPGVRVAEADSARHDGRDRGRNSRPMRSRRRWRSIRAGFLDLKN